MTDTASPDAGQEGSILPTAEAVAAALRRNGTDERAIHSVLWLLEHGRSQHWSQAKLAAFARISPATLSLVLKGTYVQNLSGIAERIEAARAAHLDAQAQIERPVVATWVLTEIGHFCDAVRSEETMGIITGRSHSGKTTAFETYVRDRADVVFVRMPEGGAARMFLQDLAEACGVPYRGAYDALRRAILKKFRRSTEGAPGLLVIDELHETVIGRRVQTVTLELIRTLHDVTGCPVVLCATPVFMTHMEDERLVRFFEQLDNRAAYVRRLPEKPPMCDIHAICAAYGLAAAPTHLLDPDDTQTPAEMVEEIRTKNGLGKLVRLLRKARRIARNKQQKIGWSHVLDVAATNKSWRDGDGPDGPGAEQDGKGVR